MNGIADPVLAVLVDELLERGARLDAWTDEEAERCRLVAFDGAQRRGPLDARGMLRRQRDLGPHALWFGDCGPIFSVERHFCSFDTPDFALSAPVDDVVLRTLSRGKRLRRPRWRHPGEEVTP